VKLKLEFVLLAALIVLPIAASLLGLVN